MDQLLSALALVVLIAVLYDVAGRIGVPYPVLLVVGGLAVAFLPVVPQFALEPELVLLVFLPPLLFDAALETPLRDLKADLLPIARLSIGLVVFTTLIVAAVAQAALPGLGWPVALTLGAIVSPTDVLAATTVFHRLGVPQRVLTIIEGEGLLNDATALIAYRSAVVVAMGGAFAIGEALGGFAIAAIGGLVIGFSVGIAANVILKRLANPPVEVAILLIVPFAAYLPAERLQVSGVLAAVMAGLVVGRRLGTILSADSRLLALATWHMVGFVLNGFAFVLIGLELRNVLADVGDRPPSTIIGLILVVSAAVIGARFAWIFVFSSLPGSPRQEIARTDRSLAWRLVFLASWSGMRGVVSLAAALALPATFPERDLVLLLTFGVIVVTLVGQGLTLPLVVRRLGLTALESEGDEQEQARHQAHLAGLAEVERLRERWPTHGPLFERLESALRERERHLRTDDADETDERRRDHLEHEEIQRSVIGAQRRALLGLRDSGRINDQVLRSLERELDLEELRMEA